MRLVRHCHAEGDGPDGLDDDLEDGYKPAMGVRHHQRQVSIAMVKAASEVGRVELSLGLHLKKLKDGLVNKGVPTTVTAYAVGHAVAGQTVQRAHVA